MRLDKLLFEKNFAKTRQKAQEYIKAGLVKVNGIIVTKPGVNIAADCVLEVNKPENEYVSRGGYKLEKALSVFDVDVKDKICLDVGASTGGFTECLLRFGAKRVYAVDVGKSQLDISLAQNKNVISMETTDIRSLTKLPEAVEFATIDVSFISILKVLPSIKTLMPHGDIIALVKPQFEAGRQNIGKNGIVKNPKIHIQVLDNIIKQAVDYSLYAKDLDISPIKGGEGNTEFLIHFSSI